jgi:voltage-gated potassium channel
VDGRGSTDRSREPDTTGLDDTTSLQDVGGPTLRNPADRSALLRGVLRTCLTVVGVVVVYYALPLGRGYSTRTSLALLGGLLVVGLLVAWQVRAIMRARHPALRAVEAVSLSLPLFLLMFAATYFLLGADDPEAFTEPLTRTDSLYFVMTVFSTVGFGDIAPVSQPARLLTMAQMIGDLVLIGVVLRLFVAAVNRGRRRAIDERSAPRRDAR